MRKTKRLMRTMHFFSVQYLQEMLMETSRRTSMINVEFYSFLQENSKKLKMKFPPKIPNRKTKSKTNKGGLTQPSINDSLEITKLDSSIISEGKITTVTPQIQAFNLQKAAAGLFVNAYCTSCVSTLFYTFFDYVSSCLYCFQINTGIKNCFNGYFYVLKFVFYLFLWICLSSKKSKQSMNPMEQELQMVVSCHVILGTGQKMLLTTEPP